MRSLLPIFILALLTCRLALAEESMPTDGTLNILKPSQISPVSDEYLLRAHQAWLSKNQPLLDSLAERARGPLADYPRYWALERRLERDNSYLVPDMESFFHDYPDSPITQLLRQQWLNLLGRNRNWRTYEAQFTAIDGHNPTLLCYHWQARFAEQDERFFDDALHYWHSYAAWPASCDPVFRQLVAAHRITHTDLWDGLRQALARNQIRQAHYINSFFPPFQGINEDDLNQAEGQPQAYLNAAPPIDSASTIAKRETWLYALQRLAHHHAEEAVELWQDVAPRLAVEDRRFGWQQLAWQGAIQLNPQAHEWFHNSAGTRAPDEWVTWEIRAALHAEDWSAIAQGIERLSPEEANKPAWIYWKAQAWQALQQHPIEARRLLDQLSLQPSYYGLLAQEEQGHLFTPAPEPKVTEPLDEQKLRNQLERPLRLYRLGLITEARREWFTIEPNLTPTEHLKAAQLASQLGWYDRSIHSAEHATGLTDTALIFPTPYATMIQRDASRFDLPDTWVYAVIRQESRFFVSARSRTGAQGLMQLMPATARWSARRLGLSHFQPTDANQSETNILLGSYYFSHLEQLLGHPILATIGYNAGPLRAQRWAATPFSDTRVFIENIPLDETRDYVQQVLYNQVVYQKRLHPTSNPRLHDLLRSLPLTHP